MMRNLEIERLALAGMSLGIARRSIEVMNRYVCTQPAQWPNGIICSALSPSGHYRYHLAHDHRAHMLMPATSLHCRYAKDRKAFDSPLNRFGQIQRHIGESYAEYMAGRWVVVATLLTGLLSFD